MPATRTTQSQATSKTAPSAPPPAQTQSTSDKKVVATLLVTFYEQGKPDVKATHMRKINNYRIRQMITAVHRAVGKSKVAAAIENEKAASGGKIQ